MVHVAALLLEREVVDPLLLLRRAERAEREDLRLPAGEERRAVRPRRDVDLGRDRPDLLRPAPVGPALVDRDLLADEVLVDRVGGLLDVRPRDAVLDRRVLAVPTGERKAELLLDPLHEDLPLAGLELLRVLLRVGQGAKLVLELLADDLLDRGEPPRLEERLQAVADLRLADDVLLARVHRDRRAALGEELLDDRAGLAEAGLGDPRR